MSEMAIYHQVSFCVTLRGMRQHIGWILTVLAVMNGAGVSAQDGANGCSQADIAKFGQPVMFDRRDGIAFGVSAPQTTFHRGSDAVVYIWLSNRTVPTTSPLTVFLERGLA
jgi:hypothetical protein